MKLNLAQIQRDEKFSPREGTDVEVAKQYAECFDQLPPMVVFKVPDRNKYVLADGWHRYRAAEILGLAEVTVEARAGSIADLQEYALLANLKHGKPLSRKEKRKVIERFLMLHPERSNSWIAEDLGTTTHTVINIRTELEQGCNLQPLDMLIGRDGKEYPRTIEQPSLPESEEGQEDQEAQEGQEPPAPPVPMIGPYPLNGIYQSDCITGMMGLPELSLSLVFTDPPYNLGKDYGSEVNDSLPQEAYFAWCMQWFMAVHRALKDGGSFYVMHYPEVAARWKQQLDGMFTFRRWISWVYPSNIGHSGNNWRRSHRAILYYIKGSKVAYFDGEADAQPYKNPGDVRIKHLGKSGTTPYDWWEYNLVKNVSEDKTPWPNQLPVDLVRRAILTSCEPGGIVCDPFMGSGTTAVAAENAQRDWVGFDKQAESIMITEGRTENEK